MDKIKLFPIKLALQETHFNYKDIDDLKEKGWGRIYCENSNNKKAEVPI